LDKDADILSPIRNGEVRRGARWQDGKMAKQPPAPFGLPAALAAQAGKGDSFLPSCLLAILIHNFVSIYQSQGNE
jgi:hypothetical protein